MNPDTPDPGEGGDSSGGSSGGLGCGMAVYAIGLICVFVMALAALGTTTWAILTQAQGELPMELIPGHEVPVWRLQALRDAGVIGVSEVPVGWHDESVNRDGTVACAVMADRLVRVAEGQGMAITWADASTVKSRAEGDGLAVTLVGERTEITCVFGPDEGGIRLERQLAAELKHPH